MTGDGLGALCGIAGGAAGLVVAGTENRDGLDAFLRVHPDFLLDGQCADGSVSGNSMNLVLVGLNHRTAPVEVRERLAFRPATLGEATCQLLGAAHLHEAAIVSTCNRVRTGLFFCSMECWEGHLPTARHRDAWAEEKRAPKA